MVAEVARCIEALRKPCREDNLVQGRERLFVPSGTEASGTVNHRVPVAVVATTRQPSVSGIPWVTFSPMLVERRGT